MESNTPTPRLSYSLGCIVQAVHFSPTHTYKVPFNILFGRPLSIVPISSILIGLTAEGWSACDDVITYTSAPPQQPNWGPPNCVSLIHVHVLHGSGSAPSPEDPLRRYSRVSMEHNKRAKRCIHASTFFVSL